MGFGVMAARAKAAREGGHVAATGVDTFSHSRALDAKITLRRNALEFVGANRARVFDGFCGPGAMHDAVWRSAASYTGCDERWFRDARNVFVSDSRTVLRAVDLQAFNVFDLDAFGCPWEHAWIVAHRRVVAPGERIAIVMTDGAALKAKMGSLSRALSVVSGFPLRAKFAHRMHVAAIHTACRRVAERMNCEIVHAWEAHKAGQSDVHYISLAMIGREV